MDQPISHRTVRADRYTTTPKFIQPGVGLGISSSFKCNIWWPGLAKKGKTAGLIFTGKLIGAKEARRISLIKKTAAIECKCRKQKS